MGGVVRVSFVVRTRVKGVGIGIKKLASIARMLANFGITLTQ